MTLKSRIARMEATSGLAASEGPGAIIIRTLSATGERSIPRFAYILTGTFTGGQVDALDGETPEEFEKRIDGIISGEVSPGAEGGSHEWNAKIEQEK